MPWTVAHAAAVLPLRRIGRLELPLLGLGLGSMSPDFGYYVGRFDLAAFAHSAFGALVFCAPATLLLALVVIRCRELLSAPLPQPHRAAIEALESPEWRSLPGALRIALAGLIGALTHIAWDAFTHSYGPAVQAMPWLQSEVGAVAGRPLQLYNLLQHLSTLFGVTVLFVAYRRWLTGNPAALAARSDPSGRAWAWLAGCAVASAAAGFGWSIVQASGDTVLTRVVVRAVIAATVVFVFGYLAIAVRALRARRSVRVQA